jgi:hypothetical protein
MPHFEKATQIKADYPVAATKRIHQDNRKYAPRPLTGRSKKTRRHWPSRGKVSPNPETSLNTVYRYGRFTPQRNENHPVLSRIFYLICKRLKMGITLIEQLGIVAGIVIGVSSFICSILQARRQKNNDRLYFLANLIVA